MVFLLELVQKLKSRKTNNQLMGGKYGNGSMTLQGPWFNSKGLGVQKVVL